MADAGQERLYEKRSDAVSLIIVISHIVFVFTPLYWGAWRGPDMLLVLFAVWFGSGMHGLLNLMHETAHYHVFKERRGSEILGGWFLSPLVLTDFDSYRKRHWQHHLELGNPRDTKFTYRMDLRPAALVRFVFRCLLLGEALEKFMHVGEVDQTEGNPAAASGPGLPGWIKRAAILNGVLFTSLVVVAHMGNAETWLQALFHAACAYAVVYLYGLGAITSFVGAIRSVAEHRIGGDGADAEGFAALRNLDTNALTRLFFGCYGFAEHAGHHADAQVPAYRLPHLIQQMATEDPRHEKHHGYLEIFWMVIREARNAAD